MHQVVLAALATLVAELVDAMRAIVTRARVGIHEQLGVAVGLFERRFFRTRHSGVVAWLLKGLVGLWWCPASLWWGADDAFEYFRISQPFPFRFFSRRRLLSFPLQLWNRFGIDQPTSDAALRQKYICQNIHEYIRTKM